MRETFATTRRCVAWRCGSAPNCFSTTGDEEFDKDTMIGAWKPPTSQARDVSVQQVKDVLTGYSPGQVRGILIDGGGFQIVDDGTKTPGYFRAMFESLKNGILRG